MNGFFESFLLTVNWLPIISWALPVLFVLSLILLLRPLSLHELRFRKATEALKKSEERGKTPFPNLKTDLTFFGKTTESANRLSLLWREFIRLWNKNTSGGPGSSRAGVPPEAVFTEDRILTGRLKGVSAALPGVFAGIGLLGTFLGIAQGLKTVQISVEDPAVLMGGVEGLVDGMSTAFRTSIYGIFFSLLWLLLHKVTHQSFQKTLADFRSALEAAFPTQDPETTLLQIESLNREMKGSLQSLGSSMAEALESAMEGVMGRTVAPAMGEMSDAVNALSERLAEQELEGLEVMVDSFREQLEGAIQKDMEKFGGALRAAADHQAETTQQVGSFLERIEEVATSQMQLLEQSTEASATFSNGLAALESAQAAISGTVDTLERATENTVALSEKVEGQVNAYQDASGDVQELLAVQLDSVKNHLDETTRFWEHFDETITGVSTELSESLTELTAFTAQKMGEVFERFDSEMATVVTHLGGTLSELRDTVEELPGLTEKMGASIAALPPALEGTTEDFRELSDQVSTTFSTLPNALTDASKDFQTFTDSALELSRQANDVVEPLTETLPALQASVHELVGAFNGTNEKLDSLQKEMREIREQKTSIWPFTR